MTNTEKEILPNELSMLKISYAFPINLYAQGLTSSDILLSTFSTFDLAEKRSYLRGLIGLIQQSKPNADDIEPAITESSLKPTFTPCVLLKKGVESHCLERIAALPEAELNKALLLLLALFKIAYLRRFIAEKNSPSKWWYWDFSDEKNYESVQNQIIVDTSDD